jgi:hypothetical protein
MNKKIIGCFICMLLITVLPSLTGATILNKSDIPNRCLTETYRNCRIQSSGTTDSQVNIGLIKIGNRALAFKITIIYSEDGNTTIYSKTGDELWYYEGAHTITLFLYRGIFQYTNNQDNTSRTTLEGKAFRVNPEIT